MNTEEIQKLDSFNDTKHEYDRSATVVDLFGQKAQQYPDNTAVIYGENEYTYAETDKLSNA